MNIAWKNSTFGYQGLDDINLNYIILGRLHANFCPFCGEKIEYELVKVTTWKKLKEPKKVIDYEEVSWKEDE